MTAGRFPSFFAHFLARRSAQALVVLVVLLCAALAVGAVTFPPLTDRVVDDAHIFSARERYALLAKLAELETESGIQLVVATVDSLQGQELEPDPNDIVRTLKLGETPQNNR